MLKNKTYKPFPLSITLLLVRVNVFLSFRRMVGVAANVDLKV